MPKDFMEYMLPFLNCTFYTTNWDNCQIVVDTVNTYQKFDNTEIVVYNITSVR